MSGSGGGAGREDGWQTGESTAWLWGAALVTIVACSQTRTYSMPRQSPEPTDYFESELPAQPGTAHPARTREAPADATRTPRSPGASSPSSAEGGSRVGGPGAGTSDKFLWDEALPAADAGPHVVSSDAQVPMRTLQETAVDGGAESRDAGVP